MKYRFNKNLLAINESSFFARSHVTKITVNDCELIVYNGDRSDWFTIRHDNYDERHKFIAKLKQELEAWLNNEA